MRKDVDLKVALDKCDTKQVYKIVKHIIPKSDVPSNIRFKLLDDDSTHAVSYVDSRTVARSYFCELFAGTCQPLSDILDVD